MKKRTVMFDAEEALLYGCEEAVMISAFRWWIDKNIANQRNFHEKRTWTYNTKKAMIKLFPFWTEKQLRRIIDSLVSQNIIKKGNFNKRANDHTGWYSFVNEPMFLGTDFTEYCPNGIGDDAQMGDPDMVFNENDENLLPKPENWAAHSGRQPAQEGRALPVTIKTVTTETIEKKEEEEKKIPKSTEDFDLSLIDYGYLKSIPNDSTHIDLDGRRWELKSYSFLIKLPWQEIQDESKKEFAHVCDGYKRAVTDIMNEKYELERKQEIAEDHRRATESTYPGDDE